MILVLIVFDNEPQTVAGAKAVGIESANPIAVNETDVVVAIDDNTISVISAMLI